jgi:hypothetical protein
MAMTVPVSGACIGTCVFSRMITVPRYPDGCLAGLRGNLAGWLGDHPRRDDAVRVADELLANAIRHGSTVGGCVVFCCRKFAAGRLVIDVIDSGRGDGDAPCIAAPSFGAGLYVVEALCASVMRLRTLNGWYVAAVLAAQPPEIVEPEVSLEELLAAYPDDDGLGGGGDAT